MLAAEPIGIELVRSPLIHLPETVPAFGRAAQDTIPAQIDQGRANDEVPNVQ